MMVVYIKNRGDNNTNLLLLLLLLLRSMTVVAVHICRLVVKEDDAGKCEKDHDIVISSQW